MAKVTTYENSKLATVCSFLGYMAIVLGVYCLFEDEFDIAVGIIVIVIGFALKFLAEFISKMKRKKEARKNRNV